jgi:diketogulonate reductase-like aldo/keto reductase
MNMSTIQLANGREIPQVGLGLWQVKRAAEFATVFDAAVAAGYRHFDSAQVYGNEALLGEAWRRSGLAREELYLTTKISVEHILTGRTEQSFVQSLVGLQTEYVDLLLLHFPVPVVRKKAWKVLETICQRGQARAIGVSNYTVRHLEEMQAHADVMPVVNQVELHVFLQQPELVQYCRQRGIVLEAYSPLAHGKRMHDPVVQGIAERHGKTYAQIMLRWGVESGFVVLPKSTTPERVRENLAIFDFEFYLDDIDKLARLDRNLRTCWSPVHVP